MAGERQSRPATLLVLRRPHFLVKPNNITALIGQNIEFHCQVSRHIIEAEKTNVLGNNLVIAFGVQEISFRFLMKLNDYNAIHF